MTMKILMFVISIASWADGLSQLTIDTTKITTEKELNFSSSNMRGIKADDVIYWVEKGGQTLTAIDIELKIKWTVDVLNSCHKPSVGKSKIRYINLTTNKIEVVFDKHNFATVDIVDGKVRCLGAD